MVTSRTRYALRGIVQLALRYGTGPVSLRAIAEQEAISEKNLESAFAVLRKNNLVRSAKGKNGGYELVRSPARMSLYEVISLFEQGVFVGDGATRDERLLWEPFERDVVDQLKSVTVSEVADRYRRASGVLNYAI